MLNVYHRNDKRMLIRSLADKTILPWLGHSDTLFGTAGKRSGEMLLTDKGITVTWDSEDLLINT